MPFLGLSKNELQFHLADLKFAIACWLHPKLYSTEISDAENKLAEEWVRKFFQGHAMLQRQRHLEEKQTAARQQRNGEKPQPVDETLKILGEEVRRLRSQYLTHRGAQYDLAENIPYCGLARAVTILRQHKDRNNRDYVWVWIQEDCAETGGCCARGCGCCEKSLYTYIRPIGDGQKREVAEVYGHCTSECPCCIRHTGYYDPAYGLPKTILTDQYERSPVWVP